MMPPLSPVGGSTRIRWGVTFKEAGGTRGNLMIEFRLLMKVDINQGSHSSFMNKILHLEAGGCLYFTIFINLQVCCSRQRIAITAKRRHSLLEGCFLRSRKGSLFPKKNLLPLINT